MDDGDFLIQAIIVSFFIFYFVRGSNSKKLSEKTLYQSFKTNTEFPFDDWNFTHFFFQLLPELVLFSINCLQILSDIFGIKYIQDLF